MSAPSDLRPDLVLRPGLLIDGVAETARTGWELGVSGGRITHVGPVGTGSVAGRQIVDLPHATLIPGLIDCHVHYLFDPRIETGNSVELASTQPTETLMLVGARNARLALQAGVTTARSAGAPRDLDIALAAGIARSDVIGPRLLPAGRAVTITGGHGSPFGLIADSAPEMVRAVRRLVGAGAQVIKAVASEAAMLTDDRAGVAEMSAAELSALVAEAGRLRRKVMAHAQDSVSVRAAAEAGVASIEHAFLADEAALAAVARSGVALTPTLVVTDVYRSLPKLSVDQQRRQEELAMLHRSSCETAIGMGIPIVTGTDCGLRGVGPDLVWREVELLTEHGMTAMEALRGATIRAARLLGLESEIGSLEEGKQADLVAVNGDPTADPGCLSDPVLVMQKGVLVSDRRPV